MKNIILSEKEQETLVETITKSLIISFDKEIAIHIESTLRTLQNELIQAYNEALYLSSMNLSLNLNRDYMYFKGKSEAYKKVINLIQNKLQNIEKEIEQ